ncbi:MAG: DUF4340 domain-containing protein [Candidatus Delongbacteria bacterium]|nr:DUF4340 domain-containing protein [Candidatus Delongbacteria bacterium]
MKKNLIYIIIIVILSVIVSYLIKKPVKNTENFNKNMLSVDSFKIIEINYQNERNNISLVRGLNNWLINGQKKYIADTNVKNTLLKFANDITLKNIISEKSEKFSKFGVDSTGILLMVRKEDNSKVSYIIGKDDQERNYSFYRKEGDDKIYLGTLFPRYRLTSNVNDWRDKYISKFDIAGLNNISIVIKSDKFEFNLSNGEWTGLLNGTEKDLDKNKIGKLSKKLSSFKGLDLLDDIKLSDMTSEMIVNFAVENNKSEFIAGKIPDGYAVYRRDNDQTYKISGDDFLLFEELIKK